MKTSEFIKRVRNLGFDVVVAEEIPNGLSVCTVYSGYVLAVVSTVEQDVMRLTTTSMGLIKLCVEYAETPIHERDDVKKYIVKLPDPYNLSTERSYTLVRTSNGNIIIGRPQTKRIIDNEAYHLTEEEVKRNHAYLWQFAEEVK